LKLTTTALQRIIQEELDELDESFWDEFKKSSGVEEWPAQAGKWAGKKLKKAKQTVTGEPSDAEPFDDPRKDPIFHGGLPHTGARMAARRVQKDAERRGRNVGTGIHRDRTLRAKQLEEEDSS
tara:strand:+ start:698 stop:1066 length:369 start_codon:yes stop_codon:yes gene_type:complete